MDLGASVEALEKDEERVRQLRLEHGNVVARTVRNRTVAGAFAVSAQMSSATP